MSRSITRAVPLALATALAVVASVDIRAAEPSPTHSPAAFPTEAPLPDLTMAPLVTLPPVAPSMIADPGLPTDGYVMGDPAAPVLIEVFADFQCPYCQRFAILVAPELIETWVRPGHARLVFRDFAFLGEESRWAAVAARLAAQQGHFWRFHDLLYSNLVGENVGSYTPDRLLLMGRMAGLDMDAFVAGLQVPAARALWTTIEAEVREANALRGVSSTPTVFVDGARIATPDAATITAAVQAAIDAREPATSPAASGASAAPLD